MIAIISCNQDKKNNLMENDLANNPFLKESTLPYFVPDFTKIKNKHFKPALLEAMRQQSDSVNDIVKNSEKATFDNTILALEKSGKMLDRVNNVFNSLTAANTNDTLKIVQTEIAPLAAKHYDEIYLNDGLFTKVKEIYSNRESLNLDAESLKLVENYYEKFTIAGANLSKEDKIALKDINE